ncbi:MAG: hypothetical protein JWO62_1828 [Acidimicrobiaceae bacterium]|jgi:predicted  nucleic acid-binding Zn-ribbon protein|nr:hypothetical protein [Acidimicrobiaceae bacterium]
MSEGNPEGAGSDTSTESSALARLLALQDEDVHFDQLTHRRRHLPEQAALEALDARIAALASSRRAVDQQRAELAGREAELELETAEVVARVAAIEERSRSGAAASYRDQEAMAVEIESLTRRRSELEEHELEVLELSEPIDVELARLGGERDGLDQERGDAATRLAAAAAEVDAELVESGARREPLAGAVPPELLSEYERLRSRLDGVGVARLVRGACSGCHLSLPATEIDRLRHLPEATIAHCEQCGRILVP